MSLKGEFNDNTPDKLFSFVINDLDYLAKFYQNGIQIEPEEKTSSILLLSRSGAEIGKEIDFINALIQAYQQYYSILEE